MYFRDEWPVGFDGKQLLPLLRSGRNPFDWDVNLLLREVEQNLGAQVVDIPIISNGSNNYGFHLKLSNGTDVVARFARGDVNMPDFDGFPMHLQIPEVKFEAAVYALLRPETDIPASRLLHHRVPLEHPGPRIKYPEDIAGRRLMVFEKAQGENNVWSDLTPEQKTCLLTQAGRIRTSLFNFQVPLDFAATWFLDRLFEQKPKSLPVPVAPTREFCVALFTSKIEATIRNIGDMIGWESDNVTVGPKAAAAKQSLLRAIPYILPAASDSEESSLYRLVLEHGDFGIHNMSITMDGDSGQPRVTSLFDWETGCIVPSILSDPPIAVVAVDLVVDEDAAPSIQPRPKDITASEREEYLGWAKHYVEDIFSRAPEYKRSIEAGKDARHLWFALRDWRGQDPEGYFGALGDWAEERLKEFGVDGSRRGKGCTSSCTCCDGVTKLANSLAITL